MARFLPVVIALAAALAGCAGGPLAPGTPGLTARQADVERNYRNQPLYSQAPPQAPRYDERYGGRFSRRDRGVPFANIPYATWTDAEPDYRIYPGDQLDISVLSAPELNRSVTVQPDGRITLPLVQPIMVADRSAPQAEQAISSAYASQLIRPDVSVAVKQATSLKIFVGGEVDKPGVYDMPGDINALQAVIMAGGMRTSAKSRQVVILRRGPGDQPMMRVVDLRAVAQRGSADAVPLRRFDVVFVPRSGISELGVFVSQIRDALPVQFSYVIGGQYVTTR
jgi:polysaccharide export outer membrane protein